MRVDGPAVRAREAAPRHQEDGTVAIVDEDRPLLVAASADGLVAAGNLDAVLVHADQDACDRAAVHRSRALVARSLRRPPPDVAVLDPARFAA
jgi:hypothetical protein